MKMMLKKNCYRNKKNTGNKVKSETKAAHMVLINYITMQDLNTIAKVTTIDKKQTHRRSDRNVEKQGLKNDVSISLDKKFETYGLEDLFAPTEEPPSSCSRRSASSYKVLNQFLNKERTRFSSSELKSF